MASSKLLNYRKIFLNSIHRKSENRDGFAPDWPLQRRVGCELISGVTGSAMIDGRLPGMSGVGPGFAVDVDVLLEHPHLSALNQGNDDPQLLVQSSLRWPAAPAFFDIRHTGTTPARSLTSCSAKLSFPVCGPRIQAALSSSPAGTGVVACIVPIQLGKELLLHVHFAALSTWICHHPLRPRRLEVARRGQQLDRALRQGHADF